MNPYAPPEAAVHDLPVRPGSAFKAIAVGLAVDIGGSLLATMILALIYGAVLGASGAKAEEIAAAMGAGATDSWFFYAATLVGLGFSVLGGYVCARIARRAELRLGAILAALSTLIALMLGAEQQELGIFLSLTLAGIGAVLAGARLGYTKNRGSR
jgi:hypothetical protein